MHLSTALGALIVALVLWLLIDVRTASPDATPLADLPPFPSSFFLDSLEREHEHEVAALRRRVRLEHRRFLRARHRSRVLLRTLMSRPSVTGAISLACTIYGSCSTLRRRAWCESQYTPSARNSSGASGLFQFLPSTWATTPFASFSIFDPYANALAAGWMEARGRGSEWVCR